MFCGVPIVFAFGMYSFCDQNDNWPQCAQCFVQIQHVEMTPCSAVCPLCFAPEGLTLRKWVVNGCAHAWWVDFIRAGLN